MARARDLMTPNPVFVSLEKNIQEAIQFFHDFKMTSAPVKSESGEIVGHLMDMDLLRAAVQGRLQGSKFSSLKDASEFFLPVHYVKESDSLGIVLKALTQSPSHRVLVKSDAGEVVGFISPKDFLTGLFVGNKEVSEGVVKELQTLQKELDSLKSKMKEMSLYLNTYDSVFQSGLYMLHSADHTGKIIFANEKLHQALGYGSGELIGMTIFDIYPHQVHAEVRMGLKRIMSQGRHKLTYSFMKTKEGTQLKVDLASAALKDEKGHFLGTFTISREYSGEALEKALGGMFDT